MDFSSIISVKRVALRLLLILVLSFNAALSGEIVKYLPGYDGELPFKLETGYISVDDSELFYYFIESQGNPQVDPLFLWLSGGPGCSSLSTIVFEFGPMQFDINNYTGGLPKLLYYPYAWTKTASFIFLDSPVGTGFSYSRTTKGWHSSDTLAAEQAYQFLKKWLEENPQYLMSRLFISGDSYGGIIVPLVTQKIIKGNDEGLQPHLNLTGYLVGSPTTDEFINNNAKIIFAHRMALISDHLYEELKSCCNENYVFVDPSNTDCLTALSKYEKCVQEIYPYDFLEPNCASASPQRYEPLNHQRSLQENGLDFVLSPPKVSNLWSRCFNYALSENWANDPGVQEALHVRKEKVKIWERCNGTISYFRDVLSVIDVHRWLSERKLEVLLEIGDRDMVVPFVATDIWLRILNLTVSEKWRPWYVDGQVAGYTVKYSQNGYRLTYATIKGAGHVAREYRRVECYEMFRRWLHFYPL